MSTDRAAARAFLRSLLSLRDILNKRDDHSVVAKVFTQIDAEVQSLQNAIPDVVPPFDRADYFSHNVGASEYFNADSLKAFLGRVIGRLQVLVEDNESPPGTRPLTFAFIKAAAIREVVERDYRELQSAHVARCWKAVLILSGGCIEGILYDLVGQNLAAVKSTATAKREPDVTRWTLGQLVAVCVELQLLLPGISKLSPGLKDYRNLVHPAVELREQLTPGEEEATIAVTVLHMLHRDLV